MGGGAGQRVWGMDGAFGVGFFFGFWVGWFGKLDAWSMGEMHYSTVTGPRF